MAVVFPAAAALLSFFLLLFLFLPDKLYHSYYTDSPTQKQLIEDMQKTPSATRTALENPHGRMMRVLAAAAAGGGGGGLNLQENKKRKRYSTAPGSSPPTCANRCSMCKPCMLVKVPVKPGLPIAEIPAEYYPEAWRCKCNGKLYTP